MVAWFWFEEKDVSFFLGEKKRQMNGVKTGILQGLTDIDLRPFQTEITKQLNNMNWETAWQIYKRKHGNVDLTNSSIPAICSELSQSQLDTVVKNAINDAKHELAQIVTQKIAPHFEELAVAAKDAGAAVVSTLGAATDAVKEGGKKVGQFGTKVVTAFGERFEQLGDAVKQLAKKKRVDITLSPFEIFMLEQLGIYKPDNNDQFRHISMGPMANIKVYKVLYYIYKNNEPLLFILYEFYKKQKQDSFQKRLEEYQKKKAAYYKAKAEKKALEEEDAFQAGKEYEDALKEYGEKKTAYDRCLAKPFVLDYICEKIKPGPQPKKRNTRKFLSPKNLSSATPVPRMSDFVLNVPKKSEKIKVLSAAVKENSANAHTSAGKASGTAASRRTRRRR